MLFLGVIAWNGVSCFIGGFAFQMGGFIFKLGMPMEGISFGGRGQEFEKNRKMRGVGGGCPPCPHYGKP